MQCNMQCAYCYETDHSSTFTLEELKANADQIFLNFDGLAEVEFFGGEPLLRFDLLQAAYQYIEENYGQKVKKYSVVSNGTICNAEIVDFLNKTKGRVKLTISIDGDESNNSWRVFKDGSASFRPVVDNSRAYLAEGCNPNAHMVTHPRNVQELYTGARFLYSLGFKHIDIGIVKDTGSVVYRKPNPVPGGEISESFEAFCAILRTELEKLSLYVAEHPDLYCSMFEHRKQRGNQYVYAGDGSKTQFGQIKISNDGEGTDTLISHIDTSRITHEQLENLPNVESTDPVNKLILDLHMYIFDLHQYHLRGFRCP